MNVAGLIFTNIHDEFLPELTRQRAIASVPYGGRYRLIDFALSNMVNANITDIGVVTHNNYRSLLDHIGTGKDWDLARRSGGITMLPPFVSSADSTSANTLYTTRLEALMGVLSFIVHCKQDYIVLSDCDIVWNLHLSEVIDAHIASGADITVVTRHLEDRSRADLTRDTYQVIVRHNNLISDFLEVVDDTEREIDICTNLFVLKRQTLLNIIKGAMAHHNSNFYTYLARNAYSMRIQAFPYTGYYARIDSLPAYFRCSMEMLDPAVRRELLRTEGQPIFTKVRNSAPSLYRTGANVSNSVVADGCIIEGTVENCIVFRGVKVGRGSVIRNSVLLQNTTIADGVSLNCVITDKNVVIRDGRTLSGDASLPFFIGKGKMI